MDAGVIKKIQGTLKANNIIIDDELCETLYTARKHSNTNLPLQTFIKKQLLLDNITKG